MSRKELPLPPESIAPFDGSSPPSRSPLTAGSRATNAGPARSGFTAESEVEEGLTWLIGATIGLRFARALGVACGHPLCTLWTAVPLERARRAEPG